MRIGLWLALAAVAASACEKDQTAAASGRGLPPANQVELPTPAPSQLPGQLAGADPHGALAARDPHAGMDLAGDPHAGMNLGGDPHAGMNLGGDPHAGMNLADPHAGMSADDPHGGMVMAQGPAKPVDPSMFLRGTIAGNKQTADKIKPGDVVFVSVKPINPATGEIIGGTIAVDRLEVATLPVRFDLTGNNAMFPNTTFEGEVVIQARVDHDGEARTKQPGDVEGQVRAKIPADKIALILDTVITDHESK
jgi:hypothetical protein